MHPPAVLETCRGVTYTGSSRLTCLARLALPAVADSIRLGGGLDDAPSGGRLSSHACCISAVADCAGFVFPAPCIRVYLFRGCPSIPIHNVKESMRRFSSWALAVPPRLVVIFFARCFPRHTNNIHTVWRVCPVFPKRKINKPCKLLKSLRILFHFFLWPPFSPSRRFRNKRKPCARVHARMQYPCQVIFTFLLAPPWQVCPV